MPLDTQIIHEYNVEQAECGKVIKSTERDNEGFKCIHVATHNDSSGNAVHNLIFAKTEWIEPE